MKSNISHQILKLNSAYDIYIALPFPAQLRSKNDRKPPYKPQYKKPIWLLHYIYCLRPYDYFMWRTDPNWTYTQIWCTKTGWALNIIGLDWKSNGPLLWYLRLSSHCRLKWPKSAFFAQMWPISDFLMKVWTAQIRFFQIRFRPLSYVVLNWIHIRCFAKRLQSERPFCISVILHYSKYTYSGKR